MILLLALALTPAAPPAGAERLPPPRLVRFDAEGVRLPDGAMLRLGSTRRRHAGATKVAWLTDGRLVSGGNGE